MGFEHERYDVKGYKDVIFVAFKLLWFYNLFNLRV